MEEDADGGGGHELHSPVDQNVHNVLFQKNFAKSYVGAPKGLVPYRKSWVRHWTLNSQLNFMNTDLNQEFLVQLYCCRNLQLQDWLWILQKRSQ